jgi:hypothetical protein
MRPASPSWHLAAHVTGQNSRTRSAFAGRVAYSIEQARLGAASLRAYYQSQRLPQSVPSLWKLMSEADRVFSARKGQGAQAPLSEKRLILSAPRRGGLGTSKSRVVEVVHVRRDRPRPAEDRPHPASWSVRAETWPEGFRAKPAQPIPPQNMRPVAPEPPPPAVHVMPMWEPSPQQPAHPVAEPGEPPVEAPASGQRRRRTPKARTPTLAVRHFADPFSDSDAGTNCMRCGYLIEPAREKRGLLTCSACG